jgi:hypothetical protein
MIRYAFVFMLFVGMLPNLHGGIVQHDFRSPDDGLLTYDDVHKREWLDLTETFGWDLATLHQALSPVGPLRGFKLASLGDLEGLANSADVTWVPSFEFPGVDGPAALKLIELVGDIALWAEEESSGCVGQCASDGLPDDINGDSDYEGSGEWFGEPDYDDLVELDIWRALGLRLAPGVVVSGSQGLAIATLFSFGELTPGGFNHPLFSPFVSGGITLVTDPALYEGSPVSGSYWLFRVVPEPNCSLLFVMFTMMIGRRARRSKI